MDTPVALQEGEEAVLLVRRRWVYLYPRLLGVILIALVPAGLAMGFVSGLVPAGELSHQLITAASIVWVLVWIIKAYFIWFNYQHDIWLLTNQRLIDSNRRHWFNHDLSSADLVNLQDISIRRDGVFPTLLNYGDVRCETAGSDEVFTLVGIPDPAGVLSQIDVARDSAVRNLYATRGGA